VHIHASLFALAILAAPPSPGRVDCSTIGPRYDAAIARVMEALRTYEKCVASSERRTDCADEIQALGTAHDNFADTIDDAKECQ